MQIPLHMSEILYLGAVDTQEHSFPFFLFSEEYQANSAVSLKMLGQAPARRPHREILQVPHRFFHEL